MGLIGYSRCILADKGEVESIREKLMEDINWTNWIIAVSAAVSAGSTVALFIVTRCYVRLTREMLSNSQKADIQIYTRLQGSSPYICVKNIGIGIARNLRFSSSYKLPNGCSLMETYFFKNGLGCLLPQQVKECSLGDLNTLGKQLNICVTYIDSAKNECSKSLCIDLDDHRYDPF